MLAENLEIDPKQILANLSLPEQPSSIFLSGSIIEGYANAESDLDVFVIYQGEDLPRQRIDYTTNTNTISFEYMSNLRLDIESWTEKQAQAVAVRLNRCPSEDWSQCLMINIDDIAFAHRIRVGLPIFGLRRFKRLRNEFEFEHLASIIMSRNLCLYNEVAEDAAGAVSSKQFGAALLMSRRVVELAIDILLASHGETNTKDKWRFAKLEKLADQGLLSRYWELETPHIRNQEEVIDYSKECLAFGSQIVLQAQKTRIPHQ